ncbi:MAG: cytidine deaminase [Muribaculaceae bacterium]|nr:cytidine deaminase [Muribaculaceae bacterium]
MKDIQITVPVTEYAYGELTDAQRGLVDLARQYTFNSYSPYSHFSVGAAIRLDNGEVVCGANQENAAFPSGTCAERSACYSAGALFPGAKFESIAIAARGVDGEPTVAPCAPCGACRQALLEYEVLAGHDVEVLLVGRDVIYRLPSVKSLLPLAFTEIN